jgi:putative hydroxymethylpyrimidine transport system ATP-binding protein
VADLSSWLEQEQEQRMNGGQAPVKGRMQDSSAVLDVRGLHYRFEGSIPLFENLSFAIGEGEFVSFLAPSGLGKTTLFRLIAGLLEPDNGTIGFSEGGPGGEGGGGNGSGRRIGYMPQRDCLMPWRTVWENAALGLELAGMPKKEAKMRVLELLPTFGLEGTENKLPAELSGGMRQRVSFLRTVLSGGKLLLLDEPFSALDAMTRLSMQEWLLEIWERNRTTVLFITHDVDEALLLSDRILVAHESPIRQLAEFRVELNRPRTYESALESAAFTAVKKDILKLLRGFNAAASPAGGDA